MIKTRESMRIISRYLKRKNIHFDLQCRVREYLSFLLKIE